MSATATGPAGSPGTAARTRRTGRETWDRTRGARALLTAAALGLGGWELASISSGGWLPGLADVADATVEVLGSERLWSDLTTTLRRVLTVWAATVVLGTVVGVAAGLSWRVRAFLRPVLAVALAIPDLVYIIMVILVLGTAESSGLVALVIAISPLVVNVVMNAVLDRDTRLDEMARTYRLGPVDYCRHVLWWQIRPAVHAGTRTAFAFSWKLIVLVEGLTSPDGVGARIMEEFRYLRPDGMIAYALVFTVVMKVVELGVDRVFDARGRRGARPEGAVGA